LAITAHSLQTVILLRVSGIVGIILTMRTMRMDSPRVSSCYNHDQVALRDIERRKTPKQDSCRKH